MSDEMFCERIGDAAVVLGDDEKSAYRKAISSVSQSPLSAELLLTLVRLSFQRAVQLNQLAGFTEHLGRSGLTTDPREEHKIAILAMAVLVERFLRPVGKRTMKTLAPDSIAALAVRALRDQGESAVHPDLAPHADYWHCVVCDHLRGGSVLSPPPRMPASLSALSEPAQSPTTAESSVRLDEIADYISSLGSWLGRSAWPVRVLALDEQQSYAWWLLETREEATPERCVVTMCEEVLSLCRFLPGPPSAKHLMYRRFEDPDQLVDLDAVAARASREVPDEVADLCFFLNGVAPDWQGDSTVSDVASALYNELLLVEMVSKKDV